MNPEISVQRTFCDRDLSPLCPQIEGLLDDKDFSAKFTRAELEEICSDLFDRVKKPVKQALEAADMTMVRGYSSESS